MGLKLEDAEGPTDGLEYEEDDPLSAEEEGEPEEVEAPPLARESLVHSSYRHQRMGARSAHHIHAVSIAASAISDVRTVAEDSERDQPRN